MKIKMDMPIVPGFKYTGEFREPLEGEFYYCARAKDAVVADAVPFDHDPAPIMKIYNIEPVFRACAEAVAKAVEYLESNEHNSIHAGSNLHDTLRAALDE